MPPKYAPKIDILFDITTLPGLIFSAINFAAAQVICRIFRTFATGVTHYRTMRRFKQQLPPDEAEQIMATATNGTLSLVDSRGEPYGVPMSFVSDGAQRIYFHCAREGRKMECLRACGRASFCIVAQDDVQPATFTTYYRSVIASGRIATVDDRDETVAALRMLCAKYSPGFDCTAEIEGAIDRVAVLRLDIESVTGKEAIELTHRRATK